MVLNSEIKLKFKNSVKTCLSLIKFHIVKLNGSKNEMWYLSITVVWMIYIFSGIVICLLSYTLINEK